MATGIMAKSNLSSDVTALLVSSSVLNVARDFCIKRLRLSLCQSPDQSDCSCSVCEQIESRQGRDFLWLTPDGWYDVKSADRILKETTLKLSEGEDFFVVVELAERMPGACANKILKTIEEPPAGYKFIFTTQNLSQVLPTIKSRCQVIELAGGSTDQEGLGKIGDFIVAGVRPDQAQEYFSLVDEVAPDQILSHETLESLLARATKEKLELARGKSSENDRAAFLARLCDVCTRFSKMPPQPGSGKVFWKNFFVQLVL